MFFWTTFGIAVETLCRPAAVGQVSASEIQSIALDALSGLLRPEVSGPVLQDETVFEEICNLLFRLGLTEGLAVKIRVLEIAVALAAVVVEGASGADASDRRLKQCLQIATTVIREVLPLSGSSVKREWARPVVPCPLLILDSRSTCPHTDRLRRMRQASLLPLCGPRRSLARLAAN